MVAVVVNRKLHYSSPPPLPTAAAAEEGEKRAEANSCYHYNSYDCEEG